MNGIQYPELDSNGRLIPSPNPQIGDKAFYMLALNGNIPIGSTTPVSVSSKIQTSGIDVATEVFGGLYFAISSASPQDYMSLQISDIDNILGYGAGFIVGDYGHFSIAPGREIGIQLPTKADIPAGLYYQVVYTPVVAPTSVIEFWGNIQIRK